MTENSRFVLGIDAGGTKTRALLADRGGTVIAAASGPGANLRTHGELQVEKVLHGLVEKAEAEAGVKADAIAVGIAGADRPDDQEVLRAILRRIGFRERVVVTNDARIAFVAGSSRRVGLALVCGTGSIAWGRNARGEVARAGGWGWHVGDEGSGFWIGERAIRAALRATDGRGPETALTAALLEHFGLSRMEQLVRRVYDAEYPRHEVALFAVRVAAAAREGDSVAGSILSDASGELVLAAGSVVSRLGLGAAGYDVVLSGGTFGALPDLRRDVAAALAGPGAEVRTLEVEPAVGAVLLALEALTSEPGTR
ncbi:MAG TPA: BadF/BadG/BcrA/BcrD ATPase family protein [Thermoanaerobaculia bacterium]